MHKLTLILHDVLIIIVPICFTNLMMGVVVSFSSALHCQDPGIPLNGRRVMRDTNVGSIATFSCNRGYRLIGEASIICRNDGHWSRAKPSCRRFGKEYSFSYHIHASIASGLVICIKPFSLSVVVVTQ